MYDINKVCVSSDSMNRINYLFQKFQSLTGLKEGRESQRFNLNRDGRQMCFLLYKGTGLVKRSIDSLVVSTIRAPSIVGLHELCNEKSDILITAVSDIEFGLTTAQELFHFVNEHQLWENMTYMLMLSATRFTEYQLETVGISNYELICNLLTSLNNESFEIRATTSALEYIQERSTLSRSGIMKTLSSLRDGGYITIKKGLLIKINMLPKKY